MDNIRISGAIDVRVITYLNRKWILFSDDHKSLHVSCNEPCKETTNYYEDKDIIKDNIQKSKIMKDPTDKTISNFDKIQYIINNYILFLFLGGQTNIIKSNLGQYIKIIIESKDYVNDTKEFLTRIMIMDQSYLDSITN